MSTAPSGYTPMKKSQTKFGRLMAAFPECAPPGGGDGTPGPSPGTVMADRAWERIAEIKSAIAEQIMGRGLKPAVLAGRLKYVRSSIDFVQNSIASLTPDQVIGAKHPLPEIRSELAERAKELRNAKVDAEKESVKALQADLARETKVAADKEGELRTAVTPDGKQALYKTASLALTTATRCHDDWKAQLAEAGGAVDPAPFQAPLAAFALVLKRLETVVEACLPKLTTKPGVKPEEGGGTEAKPTIKDGEELSKLKGGWALAKQTYGATPVDMKKLAAFRKKEVDHWLVTNLGPLGFKEGPGIGWVSVGSTDPTSDYDISINKHGEKNGKIFYDYEAVQFFNNEFRAKYGCESGTIFDTNLYASAPKIVPVLDEEAGPGAHDALEDVKASGDVGALMKMRRYMTEGEFEAFREETIKATGEGDRKRLQRQFEMADANYRLSLSDTIDAMEKLLDAKQKELAKTNGTLSEEEAEALHEIAEYREKIKGLDGLALDDAQALSEQLARKLDHVKDATMMTTNVIYAEQIGKVRESEQAYLEFQKNLPEIKRLIGAAEGSTDPVVLGKLSDDLRKLGVQASTLEAAVKGDFIKALASVDSQVASQLSDIARQQAMTMFYANEAYQSSGPFAHVVTAGQAVETDVKSELAAKLVAPKKLDELTPEERQKAIDDAWGADGSEQRKIAQARVGVVMKERRIGLPADQCLQSFNEQLGDFLKDLEHYGADDAGVAIIQSSKYLDRLIDAARLMVDKGMFENSPIAAELKTQLDLQKRVKDELIAARKGNLWLEPDTAKGGVAGEPVDQRAQRYAYGCDFMKSTMGISTVAALAQKYIALGVKVNTLARKWMADHPE